MLTKKQQDVLKVIVSFINSHKYSPSVQDICSITGLKSPSTAHGYLERMKKRGYIDWESGKPRTLKIVQWGGDEDGSKTA